MDYCWKIEEVTHELMGISIFVENLSLPSFRIKELPSS